MQCFSRSYTAFLAILLMGSGAYATGTDRYGESPTVILNGGIWWEQPALAPGQTVGRTGEFVLVKGRVLSTFRTREDLYLNFGADYKTDFTVRIPKRAWKQFGELEGKDITVRGVLREYNGPMIVVDRKEQLHAD